MKQSIAIIIPALNEEATIHDVVTRCMSVSSHTNFDVSVHVVDDGSTDRTAEVARDAGAHVVSHAVNLGVGKAFQTGLDTALRSGADVVVNIDADGQFDPERIPDLCSPILDGRADFTSASRFKDPAFVPEMPIAKLLGNRIMSRLISKIAGQKLYDVSCGFRAYNMDAALRLNLWGNFTYTQESILDLSVKGLRIEEVPMQIRGVRQVGESRVASNLWKYGYKTISIILHTYRDYWPMHFFGWVALPFLVAGLALIGFLIVHRIASGAFSPHIWAGFSGGSLFFLGLIVLVSGVVGETLKRIRLNQEELLYLQRKSIYTEGGTMSRQPHD